ncbi:MAG: S8 family serine peptidase [Ardenticatenaceae bacterium]|nr:S8 family serine peptidase [Ardenticatenaceae bacterium]
MVQRRQRQIIVTIGLIFITLIFGAQAGAEPDWWAKVDPFLLAQMQARPETDANVPIEFLVTMAVQADLSAAAELEGKLTKGTFVYEQLTAVAQQTQAPLLAQLNDMGVADVRPFWITNMVWVRSDWDTLATVAQRSDVAKLYANPQIALDVLPPDAATGLRTDAVNTIEWNISKIGADAVWELGYTGQGVVIGGQDTGYDWDHPALKNQYRGWDGSTADHNYNWHDAIHSDAVTIYCFPDSEFPCDGYSGSHGTHTMGTMVGNDLAPTADSWPEAAQNAIGVAPGAQWIGCRNMNSLGNGTPTSYTECYEWFVAPYPLGGNPMTDGDPNKAPHVINNSWGCPPSEGCAPDSLETVVNNVRAAGIVTVHSAGNMTNADCNTITDPAATYPASFTVGATDFNDNIASFSERGPSTFDGGLKPDISAPGVNIRSTVRNGLYGVNQGTSMAAPHVAGLVALLISANPSLAGDVDAIEAILRDTAVPRTSAQGCGGDGPTDVPNHVYGYGRIQAFEAILTQFPIKLYLPFSVSE